MTFPRGSTSDARLGPHLIPWYSIHMTATEPRTTSPQIRIRVDAEARATLDALAESTGQTVSEITRLALTEYLNKHAAETVKVEPKKPGRPKARFYILDRAKSQDTDLADFRPYFNERYWIMDRTTGKSVDEANTQYEARQALAVFAKLNKKDTAEASVSMRAAQAESRMSHDPDGTFTL